MRLETKFTLVIAAVVTLLMGFGVSLAPAALGDVRVWGPAFLVVSAATAYICARRLVSTPTQEMARKMWQIADSKVSEKPLCDEASRSDHLALPARAFNHLIETSSDTLVQLRGEKTELETRLATIETELQNARGEATKSQEVREAAELSVRQAEGQARTLQQRLEGAEGASRVAIQRGGFIELSSPAPVFTMDTEGTVRSWNAAAEQIFGWSAGECIGRPPVIVPEEEDGNEDLVGQLLEGRSFAGVEAVAEKKDGSVVNVTLDVAPARDASGKVAELVVVVSGRAVGNAIAATVVTRRVVVDAAAEVVAEVVTAAEPAGVQSQAAQASESTSLEDGGSVAGSEISSEQQEAVSQPTLKLYREDNQEDGQNQSVNEASDSADVNVATLIEVGEEAELESDVEVAAESSPANNVYPRAAGEWPKGDGIFLEPDEELIFDADDVVESQSTERSATAAKSAKARRSAASRSVKKVVRKAAKPQRAKARAAVTKRHRQVA